MCVCVFFFFLKTRFNFFIYKIFKTKGNLISSIERQEEENLHCLLYIGDKQNNNSIQSVSL